MEKKKLTAKQKSFVLEYLIDKNATQAMIRAGYSKNCAAINGCRLLTYANIQQEITHQIELQEKRTLVKADEVINELKKIAFLDIRGAFTEQGMLRDLSDIPEDVAHAIGGIEVNELYEGSGGEREKIGYTKKIKLSDKVRSLELLGKHLKLFTERVEHSGDKNDPIKYIIEYANKQSEGNPVIREN